MAYKGKFKPKNYYKYLGNPTNIIYRSSYELHLMMYLDEHPDVKKWASEEPFMVAWYKSPIDGGWHRYFPDAYAEIVDKDGKKRKLLIEVKPENQTKPPKKRLKLTKKYLTEVKTWGINRAKWKAAQELSEEMGWEFYIFTEKQLGIKGNGVSIPTNSKRRKGQRTKTWSR